MAEENRALGFEFGFVWMGSIFCGFWKLESVTVTKVLEGDRFLLEGIKNLCIETTAFSISVCQNVTTLSPFLYFCPRKLFFFFF